MKLTEYETLPEKIKSLQMMNDKYERSLYDTNEQLKTVTE